MTGCARCGRTSSRRIDLTEGEINAKDPSDFQVRTVLRGILLCAECAGTITVAELVMLQAGGIGLVRGCLVQCAGQPPWWLRSHYAMLPVWSKVSCPSCGGRATIQVISESLAKRSSAFWQGVREAIRLFDLRAPYEEEDDYDDDPVPDHGLHSVAGPETVPVAGQDVLLADRDTRPESADGRRDAVGEVQAREEKGTIIIGGGAAPYGGYEEEDE